MAGPMDALLQTFLGQTQQMNQMQAPSQEGSPWQQELLETVNPEKVKRQNIARALAQASQALASTPGNFLQGVSAAASTGANSYLTGRDEAQQQRVKVMQAIDQAQRQDQDRRLARMQDALGIGRGITNDQYGRQRDAVGDQRYADERKYSREQDAINREDRRGGRDRESLAYKNELKRSQRAAVQEYQKWEKDAGDDLTGEPLTEPEKQAKWQDLIYKFGIEEMYGEPPVDNTQGAAPIPSPKVQKPDKSPVLTAPPPADSRVQGQIYNTPKGPMTWTGQGWTPAQ